MKCDFQRSQDSTSPADLKERLRRGKSENQGKGLQGAIKALQKSHCGVLNPMVWAVPKKARELKESRLVWAVLLPWPVHQ